MVSGQYWKWGLLSALSLSLSLSLSRLTPYFARHNVPKTLKVLWLLAVKILLSATLAATWAHDKPRMLDELRISRGEPNEAHQSLSQRALRYSQNNFWLPVLQDNRGESGEYRSALCERDCGAHVSGKKKLGKNS
jgi:hypothetical protein